MDLIQYVDGKRIVIPEQRLEPPLKPSDWYAQYDDEEWVDDDDLDNGYVVRFGGRR